MEVEWRGEKPAVETGPPILCSPIPTQPGVGQASANKQTTRSMGQAWYKSATSSLANLRGRHYAIFYFTVLLYHVNPVLSVKVFDNRDSLGPTLLYSPNFTTHLRTQSTYFSHFPTR